MTHNQLTLERLCEVLDYDPGSGVFTWLVTLGSRGVAGDIAGNVARNRRAISVDGVSYQANRLAWLYMTGTWPNGVVDHKNTDALDNAWLNLRDITQRWNCENMQAAPSHNKSCGLLGVTWHKRTCKWMAQIKVNRKRFHIGYFATAEQAHIAYVERKREVHKGNLL